MVVARKRPAPSSARTSAASCPRVLSAPLLGLAGSSTTTRKSSLGRSAKLGGEDLDDLRRPQELALQVDELARRAQRARVGLEDAEVAAREGVVDLLGHGAHDLQLARRRRRAGAGVGLDALAGRLAPARGEVRGDVGDGGAARRGSPRRASPAGCASGGRWMSKRSPPSEVRSMPPTNATCPSTITSFSWWQCIGRSCVSSAHCTRVPRVSSSRTLRTAARSGVNTRQRRAAPQQHPDVDALGQLAEQVAQARGAGVAREAEVGGDVPAGDVHVRARAGERLGDARQRLRAVDQHLQRVAGARRRVAGRPQRAVVRAARAGRGGRRVSGAGDDARRSLRSSSAWSRRSERSMRDDGELSSAHDARAARAARRCRSPARASGRPRGPRCGSPRACPSRARRACSGSRPRSAARRS